jgi:hypothetical protein
LIAKFYPRSNPLRLYSRAPLYKFQQGHRLSCLIFLWVSSVSPGKSQGGTPMRPKSSFNKSFSLHYSLNHPSNRRYTVSIPIASLNNPQRIQSWRCRETRWLCYYNIVQIFGGSTTFRILMEFAAYGIIRLRSCALYEFSF